VDVVDPTVKNRPAGDRPAIERTLDPAIRRAFHVRNRDPERHAALYSVDDPSVGAQEYAGPFLEHPEHGCEILPSRRHHPEDAGHRLLLRLRLDQRAIPPLVVSTQ
jgi:hypothetical protein